LALILIRKGVAARQQMLASRFYELDWEQTGPSSGNTLDLFIQMTVWLIFIKQLYKTVLLFSARDIVRPLATIEGAEVVKE